MSRTLQIPSLSALRVKRLPRFANVFGSVILAAILILALCANLISPYDPNLQDLNAILQPASATHLLGTDDLGRDVASRMIHGTRTTVTAGLLATGVALAIGLPVGVLAGYVGGWADTVFMRLVDALLSFPAIVLSIAIVAVMGPGLTNAMISVGIVLSPTIARLARAQTLTVKEMTYIEAVRSFGGRGLRGVVLPHIVPNMVQPVVVQSSITMGYALLAEASLSFLGLGVQAPEASWGSVLARSYTFIGQAPLQIFVPGVAIALTVFAFIIFGDELQNLLDPKRRRR